MLRTPGSSTWWREPADSSARRSQKRSSRSCSRYEAGIEPVRLRQVMLSSLARPRNFPVDPEDGIDSVRLMALRIAPDGATAG